MRVLILVAGYGTRLYPLTINLPKPLIPINKKPVINFLIDKIDTLKNHFPIEEIRVVSNNRFYKNFLDWKKKHRIKAAIINDGSNTPHDRLGAVRDIKLSIGDTKDDWLVLGGDNLFEDDLVGFVGFAYKKQSRPVIGLYDIGKKISSCYGVVKLDGLERIIELKEKPKRPSSSLVATCIYFFPKESLKFLDLFLSRKNSFDASGKYIEWLVKQLEVFGYILKGMWLDIGQ
jgi:glucose-1-phosphate thymidylyltransferase